MIFQVRSLKSRIETQLFFEEITTSSKEEFKDVDSEMTVEVRMFVNPTQKSAESHDTLKLTVVCQISTPQLHAEKSDQSDNACRLPELYRNTD